MQIGRQAAFRLPKPEELSTEMEDFIKSMLEWGVSIVILFLAFLVSISRPQYKSDIFVVLCTGVGLIGGLYLSYDIFDKLEGENSDSYAVKFLKILTEFALYAVLGLMAFFVIALITAFINVSFALQIIVLGGLVGGFGGMILSE